jgi:hypothetical protein
MTKYIQRRPMPQRIARLRCALVITIVAACSSSPELSAPPAATPKAVGGSSKAIDVFAVGARGTILHYDGTRWTQQLSGTGLDLAGVWGASGSDVFAVGEHGIVLHYDGTRWSVQPTPDTSLLVGVWGSSGRDVFAVGYGKAILHFDGTAWTRQVRQDTTSYLTGVWGTSASDVFAVGDGTILHYDGICWAVQKSAPWINLSSIWGASPTDVFAVGDSILHYDGMSWSPQAKAVAYAYSVWGVSGNDVFSVGGDFEGDYGTISHYDGSSWKACSDCHFAPLWPALLGAVWGISSSDVFAVGSWTGIVHYDGTRWTVENTGSVPYLSAIWGSSLTR